MGLSRLWSNSQEAIDFSKLYVSFLLKSVPEPQQTSLKSQLCNWIFTFTYLSTIRRGSLFTFLLSNLNHKHMLPLRYCIVHVMLKHHV